MSTENLEIQIDANVQQAVKAIEDLAKSVNVDLKGGINVIDAFEDKIKSLETAVKGAKTSTELVKLNTQLKATQSALKQIKANEFSSAMGSVTKNTGSATLALSNLGRVAQDAPFGFIGISNNLNPLLESFQRLKAESGSTGGALKALGGSLVGAGGLGLALSAVTAAVTFAQMGFRAWGGGAKEAAAKVKDAIGDISKSVATDLVQLQSYVGFATDVTKSYDERKKAVNALQKEYPQYLKNVSDEAILTGQATEAINASIDALLRKATLSLIKDDIAAVVAESAKQILTIEKAKIATEQAARAEQERAKQLKGETDAFEKADMAARQSGRTIGELPAQYQKLASASNQAFANRPDEKIRQIKEDLKNLVQPLINAAVNFEDLGGKAETGTDKALKKVKDLKELATFMTGFLGALDSSGSLGKNRIIIDIATRFQKEEIKKNFEDLVKFVNVLPTPTVKLRMDSNIAAVVDKVKHSADSAVESFNTLKKSIEATLQNTLANGLAAVGEAIGGLLAGSTSGIGKFVNVIASGLKAIGEALIQFGVAKIILDKLKSVPGPVAIAAGIGLVALGALLQAKVSSTKFAEGGIVSGPMNAQIGEAGQSEVILPLSRLSGLLSNSRGMVVMETRVSGQDLLLVQARASGSRGRTYG